MKAPQQGGSLFSLLGSQAETGNVFKFLATPAFEKSIPVGTGYPHARSAPGGRPRGRGQAPELIARSAPKNRRFPFAAGLFERKSSSPAATRRKALRAGRYAPVPTLRSQS